MDNPFVYGEEVSGEAFWNRRKEINELLQDIHNGQNVIMFSPRRYGKTSLVLKALKIVKDQGILTVFIDVYGINTKEEFVQRYAKVVSNSIEKPTEKALRVVGNLFPKFIPKLQIDPKTGKTEFGFEAHPKGMTQSDLYDLLEIVHQKARQRKKKACVVFDEFQEILAFDKKNQLEKIMRSVFQAHRNVSYIFLGSRKHLFERMFHDYNRPFYRSGKHMPIEKMPEDEMKDYVRKRFAKGKIEINNLALSAILMVTQSHPYYTQLLCHILWDQLSGKKVILEKDVGIACQTAFKRESKAFQSILDNLTPNQKVLLVSIAREPESKVYSRDLSTQHNLPSGSIHRALETLIRKDLVYRENEQIVFQDPFFSAWLQR